MVHEIQNIEKAALPLSNGNIRESLLMRETKDENERLKLIMLTHKGGHFNILVHKTHGSGTI